GGVVARTTDATFRATPSRVTVSASGPVEVVTAYCSLFPQQPLIASVVANPKTVNSRVAFMDWQYCQTYAADVESKFRFG
ncbi:MAG: hypothetical protein ACJ8AA_13690, partial [Gemmatimonadaceae bacterium]